MSKVSRTSCVISARRVKTLLAAAARSRVLVVGDVMLDHFIWGSVARISPEAPVPVVDFEQENFMPGGAANVARNLTALNAPTELFGVVGLDLAARQLKLGWQRRPRHQRQDPHCGPQTASGPH